MGEKHGRRILPMKHLFHARKVLLHAANLRHGTSPPKEVVLRILSPLKIHRPQPGLNPRILGPVASTLTTRPPRTTLRMIMNADENIWMSEE
jgi:hypothetical protein